MSPASAALKYRTLTRRVRRDRVVSNKTNATTYFKFQLLVVWSLDRQTSLCLLYIIIYSYYAIVNT